MNEWLRRRAAKRVKPGDGRPLKRFRWWQSLSRSLFYLRLDDAVYAIDVKHGGDESGEVTGYLYLDGRLSAKSKLPAAFPVPGGVIEVAASSFGLKRCHYVTPDGLERQLEPDPASAEGRRGSFDRAHPVASRVVGGISFIVVLVGLAILLPQLAETLSEIPPIAERWGTFTSPILLSTLGNAAVAMVTIAASTERALRLRYHWLLDGSSG